ncbi:unnamed protein product [Oncorhynchus mykiss]|uniref:Uncharacterized protein n=1 Tax=Oncorhynchus mykiss TaxID=8022 RepID=A0A060WHK6_ONCMY|nr:unnamed protein product [Oncorhynchus mykiss]
MCLVLNGVSIYRICIEYINMWAELSGPWSGQIGPGTENGTAMPPPHNAYTQHGERVRTMSTSGKTMCNHASPLALTLGGGLNSEAPHTSRDSLHCSSGYSTQTTTPSCSEDTIPSHDYDYISLHGGEELHHSPPDFDKSSTIPRNSDLSLQYRKMFHSKRPASTVSLLAEPEPLGLRQMHTATIRRKPSSKPTYRRGTISGGVPIPICTPQVPFKALGGGSGSDENVGPPESSVGKGVIGMSRTVDHELVLAKHSLCTSTQSLSAMPSHHSSSTSPYYSLIPGKAPVPYNASGTGNQLVESGHCPPPQQPPAAPDAQDADEPSGGGGHMVTMIRGVKLRRTLTNDRSAPFILLPNQFK